MLVRLGEIIDSASYDNDDDEDVLLWGFNLSRSVVYKARINLRRRSTIIDSKFTRSDVRISKERPTTVYFFGGHKVNDQ